MARQLILTFSKKTVVIFIFFLTLTILAVNSVYAVVISKFTLAKVEGLAQVSPDWYVSDYLDDFCGGNLDNCSSEDRNFYSQMYAADVNGNNRISVIGIDWLDALNFGTTEFMNSDFNQTNLIEVSLRNSKNVIKPHFTLINMADFYLFVDDPLSIVQAGSLKDLNKADYVFVNYNGKVGRFPITRINSTFPEVPYSPGIYVDNTCDTGIFEDCYISWEFTEFSNYETIDTCSLSPEYGYSIDYGYVWKITANNQNNRSRNCELTIKAKSVDTGYANVRTIKYILPGSNYITLISNNCTKSNYGSEPCTISWSYAEPTLHDAMWEVLPGALYECSIPESSGPGPDDLITLTVQPESYQNDCVLKIYGRQESTGKTFEEELHFYTPILNAE